MKKLFPSTLLLHLIATVALLFIKMSYAGSPLWTFTPNPNFPPNISVGTAGSATIQYTVTNQSKKTHTLVMTPIAGIIQVTDAGNCPNPFTLGYQQSCTLTLFVNGKTLPNNINGGPVICQQGSNLQCYQPSAANILNITKAPVAQYVITPIAGSNGGITPSVPITVTAGSNYTFTATPNTGYQVDQWLVDGGIAQVGGSTFILANIIANHTVEVTFTQAGKLYAGVETGYVYYSTNNGVSWTATTPPSPDNAVNSVFANITTLYAGSADGKVYYSTNNGSSWSHTNALPDNSAVNGVFVNTNGTIYATSQGGHVYDSTDETNWKETTTQPSPGNAVNGIFVTPTNDIYVGSSDGNAYHLTDKSTHWQTISGPIHDSKYSSYAGPVQNVFATSTSLYVNTRHTSVNPTLPNPTIDFEYVFSTNNISTPSWTLHSQIAYTLFVNGDASIILASTQDGYVFSLTTGDELGFIAYTPINSLYFLG